MAAKKHGLLNLIFNIIWLIFGGIISAIAWLFLGLILCVTIIGIPLGKQCFKVAKLVIMPFGASVDLNFSSHPIANIIWAIFVGWELFLGYLFAGLILCVTIVGIPFGLQIFKLATLSIFPFGAKIR